MVSAGLYLPDFFQSWLGGLHPRLPAGRAYLALMLVHELRGLELPQDLPCAPAYAVVVHLHGPQDAFWVDNEGGSKRDPARAKKIDEIKKGFKE